MTLLQCQVGEVVREAAQQLRDPSVAQVQHDVQSQRLQRGQVALPARVVKLNTDRVLLVLGQTQHLQMIVANKVLRLTQIITNDTQLVIHTNTYRQRNVSKMYSRG